jgi:hypothetical protein
MFISTTHRSEADLQAEVYYRLKIEEINCYLEVKIPTDLYRSGNMRADIAITSKKNDGRVLALIEVKRPGKRIGEEWRQTQAYRKIVAQTGVKFWHLNSFDGVTELVHKIRQIYE